MWFFASDLHGNTSRYDQLFRAIQQEHPDVVLLGGDLLPHFGRSSHENFTLHYLRTELRSLRKILQDAYPQIYFIFGNDDLRSETTTAEALEKEELWTHIHSRSIKIGTHTVFGYAYVPPTPFRLKDWERYDVSRYVDPGSISPEEGSHSIEINSAEIKYSTIQKDLELLTKDVDLSKTVFLFHTPPYKTNLDRAALDGRKIDHAPMDVHVGSIAVRRFIEKRQPLLTLHGHIHESARIMGSWRDRIGNTHMFSAAHDGPELSLVRFEPNDLENATRELI